MIDGSSKTFHPIQAGITLADFTYFKQSMGIIDISIIYFES